MSAAKQTRAQFINAHFSREFQSTYEPSQSNYRAAVPLQATANVIRSSGLLPRSSSVTKGDRWGNLRTGRTRGDDFSRTSSVCLWRHKAPPLHRPAPVRNREAHGERHSNRGQAVPWTVPEIIVHDGRPGRTTSPRQRRLRRSETRRNHAGRTRDHAAGKSRHRSHLSRQRPQGRQLSALWPRQSALPMRLPSCSKCPSPWGHFSPA